jgi:hypothetical protein
MGAVVSLDFCFAGFSLPGLTWRPAPRRVCIRVAT